MGKALPRKKPWAGLLTFKRSVSDRNVRRHVPWLYAREFRARTIEVERELETP
jgi:hypothetical protein